MLKASGANTAANNATAGVTSGSAAAAARAPCCVAVLIGVPGAGKTTLARALAEAAVRHAVECVHLELDGLLLAAAARGDGGSGGGTGEFSPEAWRAARRQLLDSVRANIASPASSAPQPPAPPPPRLVLVDDANALRGMRRPFYLAAREAGHAAYLQIYVSCPVALALARNAQRRGAARVPDGVVERAGLALDAPLPGAREPWEEPTLVVDAAGGDNQAQLEQLWGRLWAAWGPAVPPAPDPAALEGALSAARAATAASALHALDLASRRVVADAVAAAPPASRPALARALDARRKALLRDARTAQGGNGSGGGSGDDGEPAAADRGALDGLLAEFAAAAQREASSLCCLDPG